MKITVSQIYELDKYTLYHNGTDDNSLIPSEKVAANFLMHWNILKLSLMADDTLSLYFVDMVTLRKLIVEICCSINSPIQNSLI